MKYKNDIVDDEKKEKAAYYMLKKFSFRKDLIEPKAKELNLTTDEFIDLAKKYATDILKIFTPEEFDENLEIQLNKFYFSVCRSNKWDIEKIKKSKRLNNTDPNEVYKRGLYYAKEMLKLSNEELLEQKNKSVNYTFYREILKLDYKEIAEYVIKKKYTVASLLGKKSNLDIFIKSEGYKSKEEIESIKNNILNKIEIGINYLKNNRKELNDKEKNAMIEKKENDKKELSEYISKIFSLFINSDFEKIDDFFTKTNMTEKQFNDYLKIVKIYNPECYEKTNNKMLYLKAKKENEIKETIGKLLILLKSGVSVAGKNPRQLDVIDFYTISEYSPIDVWNVAKKCLSGEDIKIFIPYVGYKGQNIIGEKYNETTLKYIFESKVVVGKSYDEKTNTFIGEGREITLDEKIKILNFLKENNIPLDNRTYRAGFERLKNGYLDDEEYSFNKNIKVRK